jgi:putative redox protein
MANKAQLRWTDGLQFIGRAGNEQGGHGPAVVLDSHDGGSGASPMELLLMGLGGCTAMDVISILQKKRVYVTGFEINLSGERAEEHPRRYTDIHIEYVVYGKRIKPRDVERSIELSEEKYCSARASLNANLTSSYLIVEVEE